MEIKRSEISAARHPNPLMDESFFIVQTQRNNYFYFIQATVLQFLQAYHSVVKDLPQIIVQMICVIIVCLQQMTKLIKISGIHENSLEVIQERSLQIFC